MVSWWLPSTCTSLLDSINVTKLCNNSCQHTRLVLLSRLLFVKQSINVSNAFLFLVSPQLSVLVFDKNLCAACVGIRLRCVCVLSIMNRTSRHVTHDHRQMFTFMMFNARLRNLHSIPCLFKKLVSKLKIRRDLDDFQNIGKSYKEESSQLSNT